MSEDIYLIYGRWFWKRREDRRVEGRCARTQIILLRHKDLVDSITAHKQTIDQRDRYAWY